MSNLRRATQADVAGAARVARSTVSLAMRNHPSIPPATRQRIREAAARLGYAPDPMLSALANYRTRSRSANYQGVLAWLVNTQLVPPHSRRWNEVMMFRDYHVGALKRALEHGYKVEVFDIAQRGMTADRLARIFITRNIEGILVCPQPGPNMTLEFPFERFASVTFGYSLASPLLHTVAPTQFRAVKEIMRRLLHAGYRRIGFAHSFTTDARADHNFLAGYLVEQHLCGRGDRIPPLDEEVLTAEAFREWYDEHRPDAVITGNPRLLGVIARSGCRVPQDLAVACASVPKPSDGGLAGIYEDSFHVGEAAVDFLVAALHQGERGIPERPKSILVPGIWAPGATFPEKNSGAPQMKGGGE
ncbi:LacI family transcriptional regulator [Opitutaceae bacterium TAV5]|nr:LacI family transcriptional regulator [Opitutaceae bacterium TAV5]